MDKEDVIYMYLKNTYKWNMDGLRDYLTKYSKPERERQVPYYITYMWGKKKKIQINLFTKQTHRLRKQIYSGGNQLGG